MQLINQQKDILQRFISTKTVGDVLNKVKPAHRDLLDLPLTSTMEDAFDLLLAEDILSVPIYYTEGNEKKYVAIVSALDLLKLLSTKVSVETLQTKSETLLMQLCEAIPISEPLTILKSTDSLDQLLSLLSIERVHRVLVRQSHSANLVLLSQMDLIRFFQANNHHIGSSALDLSVDEIKSSGIRSSINFKCTAVEAFLKLAADEHISALPIVDDNNDLIGEISAQDLRGLNRNRWDTLLKPVVMYLKACHGDLYAPLTCHNRFTLSQIMSAFVLRKAHRLWWMDYETGELKCVITLTDILSTFATIH
ncbi:hypothetical protein [Parasitella parasitica]|uniref:CBS domain-containing protein n=1 Tax=Parasitella parasitica TaxID=35722 RepID=A0A0B7N6I7_9FUNG|nr:hypothetical protein [Parasitella parasitica]